VWAVAGLDQQWLDTEPFGSRSADPVSPQGAVLGGRDDGGSNLWWSTAGLLLVACGRRERSQGVYGPVLQVWGAVMKEEVSGCCRVGGGVNTDPVAVEQLGGVKLNLLGQAFAVDEVGYVCG
jgi:hypothetical protein